MKENASYGKHVVCMLDLLGESARYEKLESYPWPRSIQQQKDFDNDLHRFVATITNFKGDLDRFLVSPERTAPANLSPAEATAYNEMGHFNVKTQRFSDGITLFSPLIEGYVSGINSLYFQLSGICSTTLMQMQRRVTIRGGIAIGGGMEMEENEFFGPGLMYAHQMESVVAKYPRIAVHESVLEYLSAFEELNATKGTDPVASYSVEVANLCQSMITTDSDGVSIVDYAGRSVQKNILGDEAIDLVRESLTFAQEMHNKYVGVDLDETKTKIKQKYGYLCAYLESRLESLAL